MEPCDQNQIGPSNCSPLTNYYCYCIAHHFTKDGKTCIPCPSQPGKLFSLVFYLGIEWYTETLTYTQVSTVMLLDFTETCSDGIRNDHEIAIDCGGPYCKSCGKPNSRCF